MLAPWKKSYDKCRQHIKKQRYHFANKCLYSQSYGFSGSLVWMWELDHKAGWVLKNWCFWTVVLEKTLESLGQQGDQSWIIIGRTDAEAPILWSPNVNRWLTGKDPEAEKDWGQEEKRVAEDKMVRWHQQLNGHEFEQTLEDSDGQGSLACCNPGGRKEQDTPERQQVEAHI